MKAKRLLIFSLLLLSFNFYTSQEVEIRNDQVLLNGKQIVKVEKKNRVQYSFYTLKDNTEVLLYRGFDHETPQYINDDYFVLNFLTEKIKVESYDFSKIASFMNSEKSMEKLIKWLLKEKVLTNDGELNSERVGVFKEKYSQNITERRIR